MARAVEVGSSVWKGLRVFIVALSLYVVVVSWADFWYSSYASWILLPVAIAVASLFVERTWLRWGLLAVASGTAAVGAGPETGITVLAAAVVAGALAGRLHRQRREDRGAVEAVAMPSLEGYAAETIELLRARGFSDLGSIRYSYLSAPGVVHYLRGERPNRLAGVVCQPPTGVLVVSTVYGSRRLVTSGPTRWPAPPWVLRNLAASSAVDAVLAEHEAAVVVLRRNGVEPDPGHPVAFEDLVPSLQREVVWWSRSDGRAARPPATEPLSRDADAGARIEAWLQETWKP